MTNFSETVSSSNPAILTVNGKPSQIQVSSFMPEMGGTTGNNTIVEMNGMKKVFRPETPDKRLPDYAAYLIDVFLKSREFCGTSIVPESTPASLEEHDKLLVGAIQEVIPQAKPLNTFLDTASLRRSGAGDFKQKVDLRPLIESLNKTNDPSFKNRLDLISVLTYITNHPDLFYENIIVDPNLNLSVVDFNSAFRNIESSSFISLPTVFSPILADHLRKLADDHSISLLTNRLALEAHLPDESINLVVKRFREVTKNIAKLEKAKKFFR